jgi:mannose-1-phosphate guanylyltransferase/phosphomannomutase
MKPLPWRSNGYGKSTVPETNFFSNEIRVFIVAGGKGTRSLNPNRAKILQEVSPGFNLIDLHLGEIKKSRLTKVTFLLSHFSDEIIKYLLEAKENHLELEIDWIFDTSEAGTLGALVNGVKEKPAERYLVILGDIAISADYGFLIDTWHKSKSVGAVVVHPNLHPMESDKVLSDRFDKITRIVSKNDSTYSPQSPIRAAAGLYFFDYTCFERLEIVSGDIGSDFLGHLIKQNTLLAMNSSFFFSDTGTPSRLDRVKKAYELGAFQRRTSPMRKSIFIDRDGTLIPDKGTNRIEITNEEIQDSSFKAIARANSFGIPVFLVTNQPGIAKGQIQFKDVEYVQLQIELLAAKFSGIIDDFRFCPHHPMTGFDGEDLRFKGNCDCRKPKIQLFQDIAEKHSLQLINATLIGDSENDKFAAELAGMRFQPVNNHVDFALAMNNVIDGILNAD